MLLQAGAMTKSRQRATGAAAAAAAAAKGGVDAQKTVVKTDMFCEEESSAMEAPLTAKMINTAIVEEAETADVQKTAEQVADVAEGEVRSRSALAALIEVSLVLLVLDVFRRWQGAEQKEKSETRARSEADGGEAEDVRWWEALMQAALDGDAVHAEKALLAAPSAKLLSHADAWGCTALHAAAKGGCAEVVTMLLERGVSAHERDAWDETPLHLAARAGEAGACETLVAFGADIDALNAQDWTPLVVAADAGHTTLCSMLLARGAGVAGLPHADLPLLLRGMLGHSEEAEEVEELFCF